MRQDKRNTNQAVAGGQAKWAALIDDTLVHAPQQVVPVDVLKAQAGISCDQVLVRDHNSPHDTVMQDEAEVDLASGNVFYSIRRCDVQDRPVCPSPAKLAYIVDDRAEIATIPDQTGETLRELFGVGADRLLIRDFESPNDEPIDVSEAVRFEDGPVFITRSTVYVIIVNGRRREVYKAQLTFDEIVELAFDDPPQGEFICFTITYRGGDCSKPEGTLVEGETITIVCRMIFMSQQLINRSPDLSRLRDDGFHIEIRGSHLLVKDVPYLNAQRQVKYGVLVSDLTLAAT